jgi:hypothetical protein
MLSGLCWFLLMIGSLRKTALKPHCQKEPTRALAGSSPSVELAHQATVMADREILLTARRST